ncbi:hypothetical protein RIR_jg27945.t1 [Rhizophagus irregularis DAOM 181602=DAOM 197198]|uniref:Uncharacterized protein n=1 Tax=Rhizophagus irregularis (strain DAOM 197198w) TaxID=1432141 RepID=A0A015JWT0_RHIIW|nr:hypothetical protein RirG_260370 [Rhizophagus irregularis DAOM 197198w]GET61302.1 hypothetical protein RIR_jg27945.t1 [Rhizophagus irregularis DAOM 181602=DAOM 197198]
MIPYMALKLSVCILTVAFSGAENRVKKIAASSSSTLVDKGQKDKLALSDANVSLMTNDALSESCMEKSFIPVDELITLCAIDPSVLYVIDLILYVVSSVQKLLFKLIIFNPSINQNIVRLQFNNGRYRPMRNSLLRSFLVTNY